MNALTNFREANCLTQGMSAKPGITRLALALLLGLAPLSAQAAVIWDNGNAAGPSGRCNSGGLIFCSGGWTIYDDFDLTAPVLVKTISYETQFTGSVSNYFNTSLSIWNVNPATNFAVGPMVSRAVVGYTTNIGHGLTRITLTNLALALAPGSYWLGLEVNINDPLGRPSSYALSTQQHLGGAIQISDDGSSIAPGLPDAAFRISTSVPEPASWALMMAGFGLTGAALRNRRQPNNHNREISK